jgi:hypothetical protein
VRRLLFVIPLLLAHFDAGAQINRPRYGVPAPSVWVSGGAALQQGFSVADGTTGSVWQFGNATTYGAALEKTVGNGLLLGVRGSNGLIPLNYSSPSVSVNANAQVSQLFGTLRLVSGRGFHSVLELSAGATYYSNFRTQAASTRLPPLNGDTDFSFAFGYGFGYSFSPRMSVDVVQDVTTSVHQKDGLNPGDDSTIRMHGTRVMGRIGLGG